MDAMKKGYFLLELIIAMSVVLLVFEMGRPFLGAWVGQYRKSISQGEQLRTIENSFSQIMGDAAHEDTLVTPLTPSLNLYQMKIDDGVPFVLVW